MNIFRGKSRVSPDIPWQESQFIGLLSTLLSCGFVLSCQCFLYLGCLPLSQLPRNLPFARISITQGSLNINWIRVHFLAMSAEGVGGPGVAESGWDLSVLFHNMAWFSSLAQADLELLSTDRLHAEAPTRVRNIALWLSDEVYLIIPRKER